MFHNYKIDKISLKLNDDIYNKLPNRMYSSNNYFDNKIRVKDEAIKKMLIQYNYKNKVNFLVYDIDRQVKNENILEILENSFNIPVPNFILRNPVNEHAHFYYILETPVYWQPDTQGISKPYKYMAYIDNGLTHLLDADRNFNKLLSKNIFYKGWEFFELNRHEYMLDELQEYMPKIDMRRSVESIGYGRNCTLFEKTRRFAYSEYGRQKYVLSDVFINNVKAFATYINNSFEVPLMPSEVNATVRSIVKFCSKKFSEQGRIDWANKKRIQGLKIRQEKAKEKESKILDLKRENPNLSNRVIADSLGLSRRSVDNKVITRDMLKATLELRANTKAEVIAYKIANPHATLREIASVFNISHEVVRKYLEF